MKILNVVTVGVRVVLGGLFLLAGVNKLLPFIPEPPLAEPAAAAFIAALDATGYIVPVLGVIEVACGALLVWGRFVPLALTLLAPIVINIALFHLLLSPAVPVVVFLMGSELYLAWIYRHAFGGLVHQVARAPGSSASAGSGGARMVSGAA